MKVLDLQCSAGHQFEGWFASDADYAHQLEGGLLECPLCGQKSVQKLPSAPRLNLGAAAPDASVAAVQDEEGSVAQTMQAAYLKFARQVVAQTEDVGERFAEEARRMHYGEAEERGIRGKASSTEVAELIDEGIPAVPLWLPDGFKDPLQ